MLNVWSYLQGVVRWCGLSGDYRDALWQPTLTAHDPNPPITLENAAVATVSRVGGAVHLVGGPERFVGGSVLRF
jgi:hypothetical protein